MMMGRLEPNTVKFGFGRLIDLTRGEPVAVVKRSRPVVVAMEVEKFERLQVLDNGPSGKGQGRIKEVQ